MYNDPNNDQNFYHYSYTPGGNEPGQRYDTRNPYNDACQTPPIRTTIPEVKPRKKRSGAKTVALALCCALLGGAVGGGIVWGVSRHNTVTTQVNISQRPSAEVVMHAVDGNKLMTDAEVYAATVNSVVSINTTISGGTNIFGQVTESASSGSGFILTKDGYIVTNYHVVEDASTIKVTLYNGDTLDAVYIGGDEDYDIAVIKIEAQDLPCVTLGDSEHLNVGDRVLAIGNPLGELTFSMSGGMVSSVNRTINVSGTPFNMIQTDASINPGNSGGPLLNQYGEVVGIVSAKYSTYSNTAVEGLGFAIPINDVSAMIEDIMTNGFVTNKPYLGITGGTMTEQMASQYRYNISKGVFIYSVDEGGAAAKAGLKMGDVLTKIDDIEIATLEDLSNAKKQYSAGDTSILTIYRDGASTTLEFTWDATPARLQTNISEDQPQNGQNGQNGQNPYYYYSNPFDMFDYFFGNPFG